MIKVFGLPTVLLVYFVHQSHKDKIRLEERLTSLEKFCRDELVILTKESIKTMSESNKTLDSFAKVMSELIADKKDRD
jgi:hypothetical protein